MADTPEKASAKMRKDIETGRRGFIVSPSAEVSGASGPLSIPAKQGEGLVGWTPEKAFRDWLADELKEATGEEADTLGCVEVAFDEYFGTEQDEAPPLDEWQPIETAPKDGTLVLIFDEKVDVYMASWINQSGLHPTPGWIDAEGDPCEPTHWMPLPSPPTTEPDPKAPRLGGEG